MSRSDQELDAVLDGLFSEYRDCISAPEPGAHFMPRLWERIDGRRRCVLEMRRITQVIVGSAAGICLLFAGLMIVPRESSPLIHANYVDVLAEAHPTETLIAQGITHSDTAEANH